MMVCEVMAGVVMAVFLCAFPWRFWDGRKEAGTF